MSCDTSQDAGHGISGHGTGRAAQNTIHGAGPPPHGMSLTSPVLSRTRIGVGVGSQGTWPHESFERSFTAPHGHAGWLSKQFEERSRQLGKGERDGPSRPSSPNMSLRCDDACVLDALATVSVASQSTRRRRRFCPPGLGGSAASEEKTTQTSNAVAPRDVEAESSRRASGVASERGKREPPSRGLRASSGGEGVRRRPVPCAVAGPGRSGRRARRRAAPPCCKSGGGPSGRTPRPPRGSPRRPVSLSGLRRLRPVPRQGSRFCLGIVWVSLRESETTRCEMGTTKYYPEVTEVGTKQKRLQSFCTIRSGEYSASLADPFAKDASFMRRLRLQSRMTCVTISPDAFIIHSLAFSHAEIYVLFVFDSEQSDFAGAQRVKETPLLAWLVRRDPNGTLVWGWAVLAYSASRLRRALRRVGRRLQEAGGGCGDSAVTLDSLDLQVPDRGPPAPPSLQVLDRGPRFGAAGAQLLGGKGRPLLPDGIDPACRRNWRESADRGIRA